MKFNFQRPDGSSVRVEAPSRDAALKYWKSQAKPPTPANASGSPDDRGMVANGPIPLTNPMADPNVPIANASGGPDERVPIVAPETGNASLSAPTKAEVDAGKNMTGDGLVGASVKAAMNAPGQVLTGIMGLDRSSRDTFTAALDKMAANADELAANPGTQQVFENMARELPSAATGGNPQAYAATLWQRFQDPAQRQAVIKELGMANAKANAGTQLKIAEINKGQQKIDVPEGSLEYYVSSIIGSTAQMAPGLIASVVTKSPLPAMAIIAAQTGGDAYTKASNAGLKPEDAKKYAALYALAETVPEALPLSLILKEGGKALPRMLKGALGEGATEMLTQGIQELIDKGFITPDLTWGEMWPRIRDAGIIGMGAGAGMGALAAGTESAVNTAGAASGEVIGKLQAGLDKVVRQSAMAADMAKMLAGKPLEERIKIYADAKRQQMETPTAAEPTAAEKGGFDPATVIKGFEGFSTTPYWDVNANRAGFGSDTITEADGTVRKVQPGDKVTREDAERDLARRLDTEFIPSIMKEVGVTAWGALDARTQAALASVTYNYGNLPNKVAAAVRTGDTAAIADAVEALGTDNNGVNANRRAEEAAIIRGEEYTPREPVEVKRSKLSTDPATYKGKRTAAVMIGDEVFTGERHAVAVQKAIEQFGAESAQIKAFEKDPEAAIGQLAGKAGESLAGTPYPAGFEVTGMSADGGAEITSVITKAAKAAPVAETAPPVAQEPPPVASQKPVAQDAINPTTSKREAEVYGAMSPVQRKQSTMRTRSTPEFKKWFGYSRVRTSGGVPMVVYHGTGTTGFDAFDTTKGDLGAHFGTSEQASYAASNRGSAGSPNVMPVYLSIQNPLRLKDTGTFHADGIADQLAAKGWLSKADAKRITKEIDADYTKRKVYDQQMRDLIRKHGHDGVVYKNTTEGAGDSYIAFDPTQIKSAIGNDGSFDADDPSILSSAAPTKKAEPKDEKKAEPKKVAEKPGVQKAGARDTQQTPFARWFAGSKAVDAAGEPLVVYHGTAKRFGEFDISRAGKASGDTSSKAIFFTDSADVAKGYRGKDFLKRGEVKEAYLSLKNPRIVDFSNRSDVFDTQLTKGILVDSALADGHDGVIFQNIIDNKDTRDGTRSTVYAVFDPAQVRSAAEARAEPVSEKTPTEPASDTFDLKFNPGPGYQPMLQAAAMPARQTSVQVSTGTMAIPDKVTIRDEPRKKLLDLIGERLYQGKVKGKTRLGFYRRSNSEVRIKHFDDIEVMAHEAAHFLEFHHAFASRFRSLRQRFAAELNPLSYTQDPRAIGEEGFAEYVRLWSTQYAKAKQVAPNFTAAFEAELKKARLWRKMTAFQTSAHRWYYQGDLARFRGKSGESENVVDQFKAFMRSRFAARFLQGIYDPEYGALVMERETTGGLASAERSPYKLRRMTRAAESMTEAAVLDGALVLKPDGSYTTTGPSLMQIFWPAVKKGWAHFDKLMEYFKARRAQELMGQGRENLFTKDEINAGLAYGKQFPEFEKIFDQWLGFNDKMLDFYTDMNRITPETAAAIRKNNTAYVPFFRVINRIDPAFNKMGKGGRVDTRLVGGERNTNEILSNILDGLHANIQSALYSRANSALFKLLGQTQDGSEFAVRIPADSKKLKVAQDQQVKHIADALVQLGFEVVMPSGMVRGNNTTGAAPIDMSDIEDVIAQFPELADFWQHNQEPSTIETMVEPVIIDGKQEYFEVNSPLLAELLTVPRGAPALVRAIGAPKRFVTKAITSTIQFMAPNITRDTTSAAAQSQSGFTPYVESLRGLKSYLANDARFKEFRVNGGLFSGRVTSLQEENMNRSMLNFPSRNGFDTVGKALAGYGRVSAAFEQGTRIGEFARATEAGVNPLEAAYRGRMISGDFAQKGRNELWGWLLETIPFANAGLRGTETLLTNMFAVDGKARFNAKSAGKLARMTVTRVGIAMVASTMILWALNNDDERYKALTVDEKSRFWHVWLPSGEHIQIPKPYGVGFIFADLPEIAMDFAKARLEGAAHNDAEGKRAIKDAMDQLAFSVMQHFWFMDNPAIVAPALEAMQNRKFTGAPIVPSNLADLRGDDLQYQRTDRTPEVYRRFSETLAKAGINISPLIAEHYMKGFTGYLEAYMVDATESLFWDKEKWGDRPFARGVLDYFTHQFNGSEAPFRTKWTEGYYDLAERAASKAQAYATLFKEAPRDIRSLTDFTEKDVNLALRSINKITTKINATLAKTAGQLISVKYDPKLTREQKEKQINDYYLARNAELRTAYEQMDGLVTQLEEGKKAKP